MDLQSLTPEQSEFIHSSFKSRLFLEGPAGCGKTTASIVRLSHILKQVAGNQILVFVPQRSLGAPYFSYFIQQKDYSGSLPYILTFGGFAQRMIELFWPSVAGQTEFSNPRRQPFFLNMETAQYCMNEVAQPFIQKGFFQSVVIEKSRLYSQILDNLNKAAVVRFPLTDISQRLKGVNALDAGMEIAYDQVQTVALAFREYCYQHNLMDYSLQMDFFCSHLLDQPDFKEFFSKKHQVIVAENIEEDVPVFHDFLFNYLPMVDCAWLIYDQNGGFRSFLGADANSAHSLQKVCDQTIHLELPPTENGDARILSRALGKCISREKLDKEDTNFGDFLVFRDFRFYPEMVAAVCQEAHRLIEQCRVDPQDIVILSPYLSDALHFSFHTMLENLSVPSISLRPSRQYLDDPVIRSLLSLAKLAHPQWLLPVSRYEFRDLMLCSLPELDIVRADLIARTLYHPDRQTEGIRPFDTITNRETQERITFLNGEKIEKIQTWMDEYQSGEPQPLDIFFSRIYGELLSQADFLFFQKMAWADSISKLILSIKYFRYFATSFLESAERDFGAQYIQAIEGGLLPSAFFNLDEGPASAVLVAPAHSFLMQNRQVAYQFWLDIGNLGWWERLNQPLTNPYLLNRDWDHSQKWTIAHEFSANQAALLKVVNGLLSRCKKQVITCSVSTNEHGAEQRGPLLRSLQSLRKQIYHMDGGAIV